MADDENTFPGPIFDQTEMEMVTFAVYETGKWFFSEWQDDVNNLEKQNHSEEFRKLLVKLAPFSLGFQSLLSEAERELSKLSEQELNELKGRIKKSEIDEVFANLSDLD